MKGTIAIAIFLFFLNILFFDIFVFVPLVIYIVVSIVVTLIKYILAVLGKMEKPKTKVIWAEHAIYILLAVIMFTANHYNTKFVESRGDVIVGCCEKYKQLHGEYPSELTDLEPGYMEKIPTPKLVGVLNNRFIYIKKDDKFILRFLVFFSTPDIDEYDSDRGSWHRFD